MKKNIFCFISAYAFLFGFCNYFHEYEFLGNQSIINIFLFAAAFFLLKHALSFEDKHLKKYCTIFGFLLSCVLILGSHLYTEYSIRSMFSSIGTLGKSIITLWGFTTVFSAILIICSPYFLKTETVVQKPTWKIFKYPFLIATLLFLAWLPCYLSYYPGIFSYDMAEQTGQALGLESITRFHPPLHTLFWKLCLTLEETFGVHALVCYSITQMALLAGSFSYIIRFLVKRGFHNGIILGTFIFFALNPLIGIFSFVPTKDAALAIFLPLYIVELCSFIADKENYPKTITNNIKLVLFGILCCLLRNNIVYAIVFSGLLMILLQKKLWKPILLWCISIVLGFSLINGPIYSVLNIKEGNSKEMLSVPMQQLACVVYYHEAELSEADKSSINEYLPVDNLSTLYNYRFADPVKLNFNTERFNESPMEFIKLWASLLVRYPLDYIDAFLNLNLPYWYPDACSTDALSKRPYIEDGILDCEYEVARNSKLPWLLQKYQKVATYEAFRTKPVIANIFSISTPIWFLAVSALILVIKKRKDALIPLLPAIALWLTFMLGPVSNLRYMYPIMILYPLYIAFVLQTDKLKQ